MKKYINLKNSNGEIKKFRVDENPLFWKVLGSIIFVAGILSLMSMPTKEVMSERIWVVVEGICDCLLGLYGYRSLPERRKQIVKGFIWYNGYVPADEEAKKYVNENIYKKDQE